MIDGEIIGYFFDMRPAKSFIMPEDETDMCPAYAGQACSYYDGQCPYCGNTIECQSREESDERRWLTPEYFKNNF